MREATLIDAAIHAGLWDVGFVESLRQQTAGGRRGIVDQLLVRSRLPRNSLYRAVAEHRGLPFVDMARAEPQRELLKQLPPSLIARRQLLPVHGNAGSALLVTSDPDDHKSIEQVRRLCDRPFSLGISDPDSLQQAIQHATANPVRPSVARSAPANTVALLNRILREAYLERATDVHFEPSRAGLRVRFRIDGRLKTYLPDLVHESGRAILSRIKVLADLDITEQRIPQDGRFSHRPLDMRDSVEVDLRVATAPTRWGERASLRLLESDEGPTSLEQLGMDAGTLKQFRNVIRRPAGLVLITGPTGSGKSTTLYSALRELDRETLNVITVEDPIESTVEGVSQIPVSASGRLGFAEALRSLLRHDPDVLMIGEIRDHETADIAIKAATTGHLVFATLHTENVSGAVARLVDLGRDPHLVGSTLRAVVGQRLVRRLCGRCRRPRPLKLRNSRIPRGTSSAPQVFKPGGCARCLGSGYRGRIGLFETLWIDDTLAAAIRRGAFDEPLDEHRTQFTSFADDARAKVLAGVTSFAEVAHFVLR